MEAGADEAARLISEATAIPVVASVSTDDNVAVIWESAAFAGRAFALQVGDEPEIIGMVPGDYWELTPVPDGWLVTGGPQPVLFLALDGTLSAVPTSDQVATPQAGDRVVVTPDRLLSYSTAERRLLELPPLPSDRYVFDADVTDLGRVVTSCADRGPRDRTVGRCVLDAGRAAERDERCSLRLRGRGALTGAQGVRGTATAAGA